MKYLWVGGGDEEEEDDGIYIYTLRVDISASMESSLVS